MKSSLIVISALVPLVTSSAFANEKTQNWPSFRNGGNSTVAGELPVTWTESSGIAWQIETDGYGQSAPVIYGDSVYVTSAVGPMKQECAVTAFELSTGRLRWLYRVESAQPGPSNYMYARAAPTPVVDADGVYAFFETGDLIAYRHDGKPMWQFDLTKDLGKFEARHGLGSSLAQSDDLLFLNLEHRGPSCLLALHKNDGSIAWKVDRPSGSSWTSPVVSLASNAVIVSSARSLTSYDLRSGNREWSVEGLEGNSVPSPCVVGNHVFTGARIPEFGSAAVAAKSNLCVKIPRGAGQDPEVLWRSPGAVCDYASPVVDDGRVYFLNKVGVLSCVDAGSGDLVYRKRLGAECWATPIVSKNGIYFFARDGSTKVIARGPEFQVIQTNRLWDPAKPPAPETYRENSSSSHGHGSHGRTTDSKKAEGESPKAAQPAGNKSGSSRGPGGMVAGLMKRDANKDGTLQAAELSPEFRPVLKRVDKNGDGALDRQELEAMAKSFAERRKNSRESSRDPIVYGVAAVPGMIVARTGTRLYVVTATQDEASAATGAP